MQATEITSCHLPLARSATVGHPHLGQAGRDRKAGEGGGQAVALVGDLPWASTRRTYLGEWRMRRGRNPFEMLRRSKPKSGNGQLSGGDFMSSSKQGHCYRYTFLSRCVVLYCPAIERARIENG